MNWRSLTNHEDIDLSDYLHTWLEANPDHCIYIGCDSHNNAGKTTFATVIVLHHSNKGGHVLYRRLVVNRIQSRYERLWKEVELSVETAQLIMAAGIQSPDYIDIDLNPDPKYQSNTLLRAAVGLIESIGLKARYKSLSPWSISIADSICK
jgi:predicted RNase H-related nuclease YkuK (DUF458 family)